MWGLTLDILVLRRQRQEDQKFKTMLGYLECLNPDCANVPLSEANTTMIGLAKPYG